MFPCFPFCYCCKCEEFPKETRGMLDGGKIQVFLGPLAKYQNLISGLNSWDIGILGRWNPLFNVSTNKWKMRGTVMGTAPRYKGFLST